MLTSSRALARTLWSSYQAITVNHRATSKLIPQDSVRTDPVRSHPSVTRWSSEAEQALRRSLWSISNSIPSTTLRSKRNEGQVSRHETSNRHTTSQSSTSIRKASRYSMKRSRAKKYRCESAQNISHLQTTIQIWWKHLNNTAKIPVRATRLLLWGTLALRRQLPQSMTSIRTTQTRRSSRHRSSRTVYSLGNHDIRGRATRHEPVHCANHHRTHPSPVVWCLIQTWFSHPE